MCRVCWHNVTAHTKLWQLLKFPFSGCNCKCCLNPFHGWTNPFVEAASFKSWCGFRCGRVEAISLLCQPLACMGCPWTCGSCSRHLGGKTKLAHLSYFKHAVCSSGDHGREGAWLDMHTHTHKKGFLLNRKIIFACGVLKMGICTEAETNSTKEF